MANIDIFDRMAQGYDTPDRVQVARVTAEAIRASITDPAGKTAIDFGCGTGLVGLALAENFSSILFLDSSRSMVEQVSRKIADLRLPNASALCLDLEREVAPALRADCVFMSQVLLHIPDPVPVLSKLFGILTPGGRLIVVDFDRNDTVSSPLVHPGFDQTELAELLVSLGFHEPHSRTFYAADALFMNRHASLFLLTALKKEQEH
ncbi:Methyltransferase type 12 [uncultured Eubacteriales bacterium]|uniref:Methyltransferase type 12 n=1 Tax=uncultured Eubacteriales bacterium TaxID=172733 RepID=A0A212IUT4_9FIRM|nr:Methyltransferase type 12 [uncultured Eubacteriales bacterium]